MCGLNRTNVSDKPPLSEVKVDGTLSKVRMKRAQPSQQTGELQSPGEEALETRKPTSEEKVRK